MIHDELWHEGALCSQVDPELFFPSTGRHGINTAAEAKRVCGSPKLPNCPVREQCLEYALRTSQEFGIWGGMALKERKEEKRRRRSGQPYVRTPRTHCDKGHELARFGRNRDGRCSECSREWNRTQRDGVA